MSATFVELGQLPTGDRDPLRIIEEQNSTRLQDLVPVRIGRMLQSPFAYYRGTAANMAADLANSATTDINVVCCGDAHISNFGFYASPGRELVFDLNDFDEAGWAPWDWDVRRLVTSVYLAALDIDATEEEAEKLVRATAKAYRRWIYTLNDMPALDRYYQTLDATKLEEIAKGKARHRLDKTTTKARTRTSTQALEKLAVRDDAGRLRITDQPPLTRHVPYANPEQLHDVWQDYLASTREDIHYLLSGFEFVDVVLRVVGVGSVGTRCFILLLQDQGGNPLFLQIKEANKSVLETYGGRSQKTELSRFTTNELGNGFRVIAGQRILQAQSDPFLGWVRGYAGDLGPEMPVDYYWRQFRDMKGSVDLSKLTLSGLKSTAEICGGMLARAHSQSTGVTQIAEYLATGTGFPQAMADWSRDYAQLCMSDFAALKDAVANGRFTADFDH